MDYKKIISELICCLADNEVFPDDEIVEVLKEAVKMDDKDINFFAGYYLWNEREIDIGTSGSEWAKKQDKSEIDHDPWVKMPPLKRKEVTIHVKNTTDEPEEQPLIDMPVTGTIKVKLRRSTPLEPIFPEDDEGNL